MRNPHGNHVASFSRQGGVAKVDKQVVYGHMETDFSQAAVRKALRWPTADKIRRYRLKKTSNIPEPGPPWDKPPKTPALGLHAPHAFPQLPISLCVTALDPRAIPLDGKQKRLRPFVRFYGRKRGCRAGKRLSRPFSSPPGG